MTQPNLGLDEVFGAGECYAQFTPDLFAKLAANVRGQPRPADNCSARMTTGGRRGGGPVCQRPPRRVEHHFGRGKALLIGTFPGGSYETHHTPETRTFFAHLLGGAALRSQSQSSDPEVKARLHHGTGGTILGNVNPTRTTRTLTITLPSTFQTPTEFRRPSAPPMRCASALTARDGDRDTAVIRLK